MNRRRMPLALTLVAVVVLASLGWLVPLLRNSQAAPAPASDASFKGKVLLVKTTDMMMGTFLLEKAQVQRMGEHSWLMGKGAADSRMGGWYKDRTVRLQAEHIVSITEFDDLKDAMKAFESGGMMGIGGVLAPPSATPLPVDVAPAGSAPVPPPAVVPPPPPARDQPRRQ